MGLLVDTFVLGPARENCYVVRARSGAPEAVVVDPGDTAADLRLELARAGARCAAILVTHCHWDHIGAVADLAEGAGAPVYMARDEAPVLVSPDDFYAALGVHIRSYEPDVQHAHVTDAGERHLEGPRDRGRCHRQHVYLGAELLQSFLVPHAEPLFLVHHH